ncbi:AraC family transcriptional regulator [Klebsiella pneumoniae]|nr:AraC family transcriptional regulator [Klebsiella pneumoniae]SSK96151.1 AraC family transcriptional regulator [Klebsiella pneumoniae]SVX46914.1 AraC family transcriptional regulator [Klebsiella pneumoniae]SXJ09964.1 AraC family transcriptional regulator [Klebsiella pneumoniae]
MGHYRMIPDKSVEILLGELSRDIAQRTPGTGDFPTAVEGLELFRRNKPAPPVSCLVPPSIVLVADGAKIMWVGGEPYEYNAEKFLITSLDLPASSEILQASTSQPCVGVAYKLDQRVLMELIAQGSLPPVKKRDAGTSVGIGTITDALLEPFCRLLSLLDEPEAIPVLGPLIQREIHYRLLMSDQSDHLRQIAAVDGHGYRIGKAIDWLKTNIASPLRVEELASRVQMSTPSFHHHFRQLAGMSPLRYQKWLRLNEARRLMLNEHYDVTTAAYAVGYESLSHFSREYTRMFGESPKRDITELRKSAGKL